MFHDGITPVDDENARGHNAGYLCGFLEFFYFCQHADADHGQKVNRASEKEDYKIKHAFDDVVERDNIGQRKQKRRADINAYKKTHDNGIAVMDFRGKAQIIFLFGKAGNVQDHNDGNEDQG